MIRWSTGLASRNRLPAPSDLSYRLHKVSGQAVVTLNDRDCYLGVYNSPESRARYEQLLAEWLAHGRRLPRPEVAGRMTIVELLTANPPLRLYVK